MVVIATQVPLNSSRFKGKREGVSAEKQLKSERQVGKQATRNVFFVVKGANVRPIKRVLEVVVVPRGRCAEADKKEIRLNLIRMRSKVVTGL